MPSFTLFFLVFSAFATVFIEARHCQKYQPDPNAERIKVGYYPQDAWSRWYFRDEEVLSYFDMHLTNDTTDACYLETFDLVTVPYVKKQYLRWQHVNPVDVPLSVTFPPDGAGVLKMWDNKMYWKEWMTNIGLGKFIPSPIDLKNPTYPCILKAAAGHFATGVWVITNSSELDHYVHDLREHHKSYFLEEALSGMGLDEGSVFTSSFEGSILSMRCMVRSHDPRLVKKQGHEDGLFVRGKTLTGGKVTVTDCGVDVANAVEKMIRKGAYSGASCINFKMNAAMEVKFLEVNARTCYTLSYTKWLFLGTYIPLAFAIMERRIELARDYNETFAVPKWYYNPKFRDVVKLEKAVAMSGESPQAVKLRYEFDETKTYAEGI